MYLRVIVWQEKKEEIDMHACVRACVYVCELSATSDVKGILINVKFVTKVHYVARTLTSCILYSER